MREWLAYINGTAETELSVGGFRFTPAGFLTKVLLVLVVVLATRLLARWARRLNEHGVFRRVEPGPRYTIIRLVQYGIYVLGVVVGLRVVDIDLTAITVALGAIGVGAGLGLQSVVANFVAGLVLLFERPVKVHDFVSTDNIEGRVQEIRFRSTLIQTNDNISIIVPNSDLTGRSLINWSHEDSNVRLHIPVGVAYGSDVALVTKTLLEVAAETDSVLKQPSPEVFFREFGDSSLNFDLLVWTAHPEGHSRLRSRLNYGIDAAFRKNGVEIPFPQRDLHVKSATALAGWLEKPTRPPGRAERPGSESE